MLTLHHADWLPWLLVAALLNGLFGFAAWRCGSVDSAGAAVGALLGLTIAFCQGLPGLLLVLFVGVGSGLTRLRYAEKAKLGAAEARCGRRGVANALANCGVAALCAALSRFGDSTLWEVAFAGALAAALADTTESELGMLLGRQAYLPPRFKPVTPGTEGAVSWAGTLCGALAAMVMAATAGLGTLGPLEQLAVAAGGFAATVLESFVGAGRQLNNHLLNTVTTATGAGLAALIAGLASGALGK